MSDHGPEEPTPGGDRPPPPPPPLLPPPPNLPPPPSGAKGRNWKKIGLIAAGVFVVLLVLAALAPDEKKADETVAAKQTSTTVQSTTSVRRTTTTEATTTTARPTTTETRTTTASDAGPSCSDFKSQAEAQAAFEADPVGAGHLDGDGDGMACAGTAYQSATTAPAPPPTAAPPCDLTCQMSKDSGVYDIPIPRDSKALSDAVADVKVSSRAGNIDQVTAFYGKWMDAHGWGYDDNSTPDAQANRSDGLGYFANLIYCRDQGTSLSIMVGPHPAGNQDKGHNVEISIIKLPDEPC